MAELLERAREDVQRASDRTDDDVVRERLRSIDEALKELVHSEREEASPTDSRTVDGDVTTEGAGPHGDELQQVEETLAALGDDSDGRTRSLVQDARDRIDGYRQRYTRDW